MRVAVADVLARLAAQHEIAFLLTRPDAPRGRGRRLAPPPAKETAERLGIEVHQPARPELPPEPVDAVVVCAYGLLIPAALLEQALWLNVHPSLLPRWRGAAPVERAILAGDEETGVTIHETVEALDAGADRGAGGFPDRPDDDAGSVFARAAEVAARLLDDVIPAPSFSPQPEGVPPTPRRSGPPTASSTWQIPSMPGGGCGRSPHIGAWATLHRAARDRLARRLEDGAFVPEEVQPGGTAPDELRRVPARRPAVIAPARRVAFEVVRRVFEDGRLRRPRPGGGRSRARPARPRARPADRVRDGPAQADARPRHRHARPATGEEARPAGAGGAAGRGLRARLERGAGARRRRRRGRARSRGRARARDRVHECGRPPARRGIPQPRRRAARGPAEAFLSGLDLRDVGARLGRRGRACADARPERAERARRPLGRAGRRADRRPGRLPGRPARSRCARRGSGLAAEPRLPARGARGRLGRRRARPRRLCSARRQGDDAPRRGDGRRAARRPRPRAGRERAPPRRHERPRGQRRRPRARRERLRPRSSMRPAPASACSAAGPTCAGARPCQSSSSSCCVPPPSEPGPAAPSSTRSAR